MNNPHTRLIIALLLVTNTKILAQQIPVKGIVSIFNSETLTGHRIYVKNAQVIDDFKRAQPAMTDKKGNFVITYVGVPEKKTVSIQVNKKGLQVVNTDKLIAVLGQEDSLKIGMAHPDSIASYRLKIYNIRKTEAENSPEIQVRVKNERIKELLKESSKNQELIKGLYEELSLIEQQRKLIAERAEDLARRYAPINLDDAAPLFREAFALLQRGELDLAQHLQLQR